MMRNMKNMDCRNYTEESSAFERCGNCCDTRTEKGAEELMEIVNGLMSFLHDTLVDMLDHQLEKLEEDYLELGCEDPQLKLLVLPGGPIEVVGEDELEELYPRNGFPEVFMSDDEGLLMAAETKDLISLGGTEYLVGPMIVFEIDDDGNETSITRETIAAALEFAVENQTQITVDGRRFCAIRLE